MSVHWCVCTGVVALYLFQPVSGQANVDGGRSQLPGMKQDIFDQVQRNKKNGPQPRGKAPPPCPKSDMMSPFYSLAYASGEIFVRMNSSEGHCQRLISVGGANFSELKNASRTCGPVGEWKNRIAENLSSMFFQGGFDWVKHSNETIEVVTEDGTFQVEVNEEKYDSMMVCWRYACGCEQAANPLGRAIGIALLIGAIGFISADAIKLLFKKGKKPPKHVQCKKGHKVEEGKLVRTHSCDVCYTRGTMYACAGNCGYDMCKKCYKDAKSKIKTAYKEWLEKHPEDAKKEKKEKDEDKEEEDDDTRSKDETSGAEKSENESTKDDNDGDEKKDTDKSEAETSEADGKDEDTTEASEETKKSKAKGDEGGEEEK